MRLVIMSEGKVTTPHVSNELSLVNLPFVVDTFDKLETFRNPPALWDEY